MNHMLYESTKIDIFFHKVLTFAKKNAIIIIEEQLKLCVPRKKSPKAGTLGDNFY